MNPIISGLLSGGASLIGSIFSSQTSAQNTQAQLQNQKELQSESENFNAAEAELNRNFQAQQIANQQNFESVNSNTAYQRASADMQLAGLNPAAMFGSGSAASTPSVGAASGSAASVSTPSAPMPQNTSAMAGIAKAAEVALNSAITAKTYDKMTEEIANLKEQQARTAAETSTERERPALVQAQVASEKERPALIVQQGSSAREQALKTANESSRIANEMPESRLKGMNAQSLIDMPQWVRDAAVKAGFVGNKVDDALAPILNSAKAARSFSSRFYY